MLLYLARLLSFEIIVYKNTIVMQNFKGGKKMWILNLLLFLTSIVCSRLCTQDILHNCVIFKFKSNFVRAFRGNKGIIRIFTFQRNFLIILRIIIIVMITLIFLMRLNLTFECCASTFIAFRNFNVSVYSN